MGKELLPLQWEARGLLAQLAVSTRGEPTFRKGTGAKGSGKIGVDTGAVVGVLSCRRFLVALVVSQQKRQRFGFSFGRSGRLGVQVVDGGVDVWRNGLLAGKKGIWEMAWMVIYHFGWENA